MTAILAVFWIFLKNKACEKSPERPDFTIHITAHKYSIVKHLNISIFFSVS